MGAGGCGAAEALWWGPAVGSVRAALGGLSWGDKCRLRCAPQSGLGLNGGGVSVETPPATGLRPPVGSFLQGLGRVRGCVEAGPHAAYSRRGPGTAAPDSVWSAPDRRTSGRGFCSRW